MSIRLLLHTKTQKLHDGPCRLAATERPFNVPNDRITKVHPSYRRLCRVLKLHTLLPSQLIVAVVNLFLHVSINLMLQ